MVFILLISVPHLASAHAYIVKSTPSENEIMNQSPGKVAIQFDEEIQAAFHSLKVVDQTGKRVDQNDAHINKKNQAMIEASLKPKLQDGTYTIQWNVISSDGHPISGTIPFQIGDAAKSGQQAVATTTGYTPHADMIIIRWLFYLSCSLFIGKYSFKSLLIATACPMAPIYGSRFFMGLFVFASRIVNFISKSIPAII